MKNNRYIVFAAMGIELVGIMLACIYLGRILDQKYNSQGLLMVFLSMLGLGGWIYQMVVMAKNAEKNAPKEEPEQNQNSGPNSLN